MIGMNQIRWHGVLELRRQFITFQILENKNERVDNPRSIFVLNYCFL